MSAFPPDVPSASSNPSEGEAERFDPKRDGPDLAYEHLHRYLLAADALEGLRVLDLGAGTGYGARMLSRSAASLVALDLEKAQVDSTATWIRGDGQQLPFADASFDAVVCFETIEHVPDPARLVSEAKRVLRGPRVLLISTPDREIYTERAGHMNPFHVAEMSRPEFQRLLRRHFGHVRMLGQGLWAGSWVAGLAPGQSARGLGKRSVQALALPDHLADLGTRPTKVRWADREKQELPTPVYLLAACADSPEGKQRLARALPSESILHDPGQWLLGQYDRLAQAWGTELESFRAELAQARRGHEDQSSQIQSARQSISRLEGEIEQARRNVSDLETQLLDARRVAEQRDAELEVSRRNAEDQRRQIESARRSVEGLESQLAAANARASAEHESLSGRLGQLSGAAESSAARARSLEDDLARRLAEIDEARVAAGLLESQMSTAREANEDLLGQVASAQSAIGELESQLARSRELNADLEDQVAVARTKIDGMRVELETARAAADDQASRLEIARQGVDEKEAELDEARRVVAAKDDELAVAKRAFDEKERALEAALGTVAEKDRELAGLREAALEMGRRIEAADSAARAAEARFEETSAVAERRALEISAQQAKLDEAERRAQVEEQRMREQAEALDGERRERARLESSMQRRFARAGIGISDWIDRWKGRGR